MGSISVELGTNSVERKRLISISSLDVAEQLESIGDAGGFYQAEPKAL